jgi:hypothetical protein
MSTPQPPDSSLRLWNPNAAALWSLLFSPAFGAFLHARNAESMNRTGEAKANMIWFYITIAYYIFGVVSEFFPPIPDAVFQIAILGLIFGWFFSIGRKQIQHVENTYQNNYQRKSWAKPMLIAIGCYIGFIFALFISAVIKRLILY